MIQIKRTNGGDNVIVYAETFEHEAYEQVKKLANYEAYRESKIRIMPDAHAGKGCTVGTTMTYYNENHHKGITNNILCVNLDNSIKYLKQDEVFINDLNKKFYESGSSARDFVRVINNLKEFPVFFNKKFINELEDYLRKELNKLSL